MLFLSFFCTISHAQEKVLEDISEMKNVEVTYITKNMLQSMSKSNITIGGLNISKIAKELTSLHIINVKEESTVKARNKMRSVLNDEKFEVIMRMKEDDERTDILGKKDNKGDYISLLLNVDEGDEITIVYMTGNIGQNCLAELSNKAGYGNKKRTNIYIANSYGVTDFSELAELNESLEKLDGLGESLNSLDKLNLDNNIQLIIPRKNTYDELIEVIEDSIKEINKIIKQIVREELNSINKELNKLNRRIAQTKNKTERNKLCQERVKLYSKRHALYKKRDKQYKKRSALYSKRNDLYAKQNSSSKNTSNSASFSISDGNIDQSWIKQIEKAFIKANYNTESIKIKGDNKELASAIHRISEINSHLANYNYELMQFIHKNELSDEYVNTLSKYKKWKKLYKAWCEIYQKIYNKISTSKYIQTPTNSIYYYSSIQ